MAGTKAGGARTAATNKARHGNDFYQRIALEHWADPEAAANHKPGGFHNNPELARRAGSIGGKISKRGSIHPIKREML